MKYYMISDGAINMSDINLCECARCISIRVLANENKNKRNRDKNN